MIFINIYLDLLTKLSNTWNCYDDNLRTKTFLVYSYFKLRFCCTEEKKKLEINHSKITIWPPQMKYMDCTYAPQYICVMYLLPLT